MNPAEGPAESPIPTGSRPRSRNRHAEGYRGVCSADLWQATGDGYNSLTVIVRPDRDTERDLVVTETVAARGSVVEEDGRPIGGALVRAVPTFAHRVRDGRSYEGSPPWLRGASVAATDAQGRFSLAGLCPGLPYRFVPRAPDGREEYVGPLLTAPGEARTVTLRHREVGLVRVRLLDGETGEPIPGARVGVRSLEWVDWLTNEFPESEITDDRGRAAVAVPHAGSYEFMAFHPDDHGAVFDVEARPASRASAEFRTVRARGIDPHHCRRNTLNRAWSSTSSRLEWSPHGCGRHSFGSGGSGRGRGGWEATPGEQHPRRGSPADPQAL